MVMRFIWSYGPALLSLTVAALFVFAPFGFLEYLNQREAAPNNLASAVFDLSSILSALMFGLYTFIVSTVSGYYQDLKSRSPQAYFDLRDYFISAIVSGMWVVIITVPVLIISEEFFTYSRVIVLCWSAMVIWAILLSFRAMIYFAVLSYEDNPRTSVHKQSK